MLTKIFWCNLSPPPLFKKNGILARWYLNFPMVHNMVFSQTSPHFLFQLCGIKFSPDTTSFYEHLDSTVTHLMLTVLD